MKIFPPLTAIMNSFVILSILTSCAGNSPKKPQPSHGSPIAEVLVVTSTPTYPPATSKPTLETAITIDGVFDDWKDRQPIGSDDLDDHVPGTPDISQVFGFSNDRFFYLFLKLNSEGTTDHYDIIVDIDGNNADYQVSIWPNQSNAAFSTFPVSGRMDQVDGVVASEGKDGVEIKLPLSLLGNSAVRTVFIQSYTSGSKSDDFVDTMESPLAFESEPVTVADPSQPSADNDTQIVETGYCSTSKSKITDYYTILEPNVSAKRIWSVQFVPWWVRPGPDGKILAISNADAIVYELKPDGSLGIFFNCPGQYIESFAYATDGALWFATRDGGRLFRVFNDEVQLMAEYGNRHLETGPDGSVYALEDGLTKIETNRKITKLSDQVFGRHFAVSKDGTAYVVSDGAIVRVLENGDTEVLADGYGPETWLTFNADDELFATHWRFLHKINAQSGEVTVYSFMNNSNIGESGAFAADGRLILYHPNVNVFAINLETQAVDVIYHVVSNSWAMALDPKNSVYIAFGDKQPNGETTIYKVDAENSLVELFRVPYGNERAMRFDLNGNGYLSVHDQKAGYALIKFDPARAEWQELTKPNCAPGSIARDPTTGEMWMEVCGEIKTVPTGTATKSLGAVPNTQQHQLAITSAGEFYQIAFFHRTDPSAPYPRKLFKYDLQSKMWLEVADLTQLDAGITMATLVACPSGTIYTVESLGAESTGANHSSFNGVRRLEDDGTLTVLGYDFEFDGQAADCAWDEDSIVFTSGAGIYKVSVR